MDTDGTNLQLDEQNTEQINQNDVQEEKDVPSLLVIEKLKVYLRDGPNAHHVETISFNDKYYDLPTNDQLESIELNEQRFDELLENLNLKKEDFRGSSSSTGISRPESLYVHGVNNMSTQEIFNYFEDFQPMGIEWISDQSCNLFWNETLLPLKLILTKTNPGPVIARQRPNISDQTTRSGKRKASDMLEDDQQNSTESTLPRGHWREGTFEAFDKPDLTAKFYIRYSTIQDRKRRGAENQSEYYRQHGNPNYNNMTGLISRSKKRELRANRFRDYTIVKSNDQSSTDLVEEIPLTTNEDNSTDPKVKFTVVLPPKKNSSNEDEDEDSHRSKRQRRERSWENNNEDDDDDNDRHHQQRRRDKTHFTVTLDSASKHSQHSKHRSRNDDSGDDNNEATSVLDARQILERKRRNRN